MSKLPDLAGSIVENSAFACDKTGVPEKMAPENNPKTRISVTVVSEARLLAEGLAFALAQEPSLTVSSCLGDLHEVIPKILLLQPHLVLLNTGLRTGSEAVGQLRSLVPKIKVVAFAITEEPEKCHLLG